MPTKLGVLRTDGVTLLPIAINTTNGGIKINTTDVITYTPTPVDPKDANFVNVWLFQSTTDGLTYPCNVDADGALLVDI